MIWNIIVAIIFLIIQQSPLFASFNNGNAKSVISYSIYDWIMMFGYNPIATQFWFIRDLILLNILAPILYFLAKKISFWSIIPFLILWLINPEYRFFNLNYEALLFFYLGGFASKMIINNHLKTLASESFQ